ncbi:MAG: BrnT family toxin [Treponemataceae bacterium]|nr:BrnT family toxin [Treponemataceae bacterium]
MATVVSDDGKFEWDLEKDEANFRKHGFHFAEILEVFDDPYFFEMYDTLHSSDDEERMVGVGNIQGMLVVTTVFTERTRTRIISSRRATAREEALYYERHNFDGR